MIEEKDIGTPRLTDFIAKSVTDPNDDHRLELLAIHASEDSKRTLENALASSNFEDVGLEGSDFRPDPTQQYIVPTPSDRWTFSAKWKYASGRILLDAWRMSRSPSLPIEVGH